MSDIKFSVVIPACNAEKYIIEDLKSVRIEL
jgi:glycosyltransferase involved in cell wall biosynthesis